MTRIPVQARLTQVYVLCCQDDHQHEDDGGQQDAYTSQQEFQPRPFRPVTASTCATEKKNRRIAKTTALRCRCIRLYMYLKKSKDSSVTFGMTALTWGSEGCAHTLSLADLYSRTH